MGLIRAELFKFNFVVSISSFQYAIAAQGVCLLIVRFDVVVQQCDLAVEGAVVGLASAFEHVR